MPLLRPSAVARPIGTRPCARAIALIVAAGILGFGATQADAHGRSLSYSSWQLDEAGAQVTVRTTLLELSRLAIELPVARSRGAAVPSGDAVGHYLQNHLRLDSDAGACVPDGPAVPRPAKEGWAVYRWHVACPSPHGLVIRTRILLDEAPSHMHFARIRVAADADGSAPRIRERVLTEGAPSWPLEGASGADPGVEAVGSGFVDYVALGVEHILTGWDHLAFVLALILLAGGLGEVARLVTGFTLAHSLTLALAVLGLVHPASAPIEAVIGLSVALVAAENGWQLGGHDRRVPITGLVLLGGFLVAAAFGRGQVSTPTLAGLLLFCACHFALLGRTQRQDLNRIALAFAFGLVHGFGFAGVLAEVALPADRLVPALLGFNIGVELGQLAVVALIWPTLALLKRTREAWLYRATAEWASAGVCGLGLYWFASRALGGG